jgi:hypothetical protein
MGADVADACYSGGMKRNRADTGTITGIAEATAERVRLSGQILQAMAHVLAANEQTQRKFRCAVINKLARIEALLGLVHVSQLARDQQPVNYYEEKLLEDSQAAEEYISRTSYEAGLTMVKYIYGEGEEVGTKTKKRRKWVDCPLYEI